MDAVYQAIKNFFKSFINLFVAVIELLTSLINCIACLLEKLHPHFPSKYTGQIPLIGKLKKKGYKEEQMQRIRDELENKVTDRDQYYQICAQMKEDGNGFYAIALAIFFFVLAAGLLLGSRMNGHVHILMVIAGAFLCVVFCLFISHHQKRVMENHMIALILETEYKDRKWTQDNQEKDGGIQSIWEEPVDVL